jgi:hypothetical protein
MALKITKDDSILPAARGKNLFLSQQISVYEHTAMGRLSAMAM